MCSIFVFFCVRRPPVSTRTDTRFPAPAPFLSGANLGEIVVRRLDRADVGQRVVRIAPGEHFVVARLKPATPALAIELLVRCLDLHRRCACECHRSEENTSELQPLMRISFAVCCLKQTKTITYIR